MPPNTVPTPPPVTATPTPKPLQQGVPTPSAHPYRPRYVLTAADVGKATFTFGGRSYTVADEIGRQFAQSDIGQTVQEIYTPNGWVLGFA